MSENIGKLTAPSGEGASIEVNSDNIIFNNLIYFPTTPINTDGLRCSIVGTSNNELRFFANKYNSTTGINTAALFLYGSDIDSLSGQFRLRAYNKTTDEKYDLIGRTNGDLLFNNLKIESVYSSSTNHIQYTNGLLIQWGYINQVSSAGSTVTLPIAYKDGNYGISAVRSATGNGETNLNIRIINNPTSISFEVANSTTTSTTCRWMTIGYWK